MGAERSGEVMVDVCQLCGHRCVYCDHQRFGRHVPEVMEVETFKRILGILDKEKFKRIYMHKAGDPALHPDFWGLLRYVAYHTGLDVLLASKFAAKPIDIPWMEAIAGRFWRRSGSLHIIVEVPTLSQSVADRVTRGVDVDVQAANLRALAAVSAKHGGERGLRLEANTIVSAHNEEDCEETGRAMWEMGVTWQTRSMGYFGTFLTDEQRAEVERDYPKGAEYRRRFDNTLTGACRLVRAPAVNPDGSVVVCCHDMLNVTVAGNVLEAGSMRSIMRSKRYMDIRKAGGQRRLPLCVGCN